MSAIVDSEGDEAGGERQSKKAVACKRLVWTGAAPSLTQGYGVVRRVEQPLPVRLSQAPKLLRQVAVHLLQQMQMKIYE